jgi:hypothetical protein
MQPAIHQMTLDQFLLALDQAVGKNQNNNFGS